MSRRSAERHKRRSEVRFWRRSNAQMHTGFTIDLSRTGMFLGTSVQLQPGERLRLEVMDKENGFVVEGVVARVHKVSLALRHIEQPGVGIRFLPAAELVSDLLAAGKVRKSGTTVRQMPTGASPAVLVSEGSATGDVPAPAMEIDPPKPPAPPEADAAEERRADLENLFGADPAASETPAAPPAPLREAPASRPLEAGRVVGVEFIDKASFLAVYHRDIVSGGLFVTSETPAELHEVVTVELRPPVELERPLRFEARVVHRIEPASGSGDGALAGMGVQFLDPDRVRAALEPVLAGMRG